MSEAMLIRKWGRVIFLSLFMLASEVTHAEISHYAMKGVHDLIAPQYEFLSPIYGYTLLGTKILQNLRFYGNYEPPQEELYGCLDRKSDIGKLLRKNNDCPQDATSKLIQRLFPSQDTVNFVANKIGSDSVSHLDSEILGKLLGRISKVPDGELSIQEKVNSLESDLKEILFHGLHPTKFFKK